MMDDHEFKYSLGDRVRLMESSEEGLVVGRAEYIHADDCYLIRYAGGDGVAREVWWTEDALCELSGVGPPS